MYKKTQYFLSRFGPTIPVMRFLAHIKNNVLNPNHIDKLINEKMIPDWQKMKILDLGSGPCNIEKDKRFRGVDITCIDIFKPYLKKCKDLGYKVIHADIKVAVKKFPDKSFDIVWAFDILEHLKKKEALMVLKHMERIAKKQVLVWIPEGYYPQDADITGDGNIHQEHKSTWHASDFKKRGYKVEVNKNVSYDIRPHSKKLLNRKKPVFGSQMWAIKKV